MLMLLKHQVAVSFKHRHRRVFRGLLSSPDGLTLSHACANTGHYPWNVSIVASGDLDEHWYSDAFVG